MIDGPRILPRSGGKPTSLVVFLHGYGADGNDLIGLADPYSQLLPDAAFVSPNAPEPCGGAPYGRQWFELTFRDPNERWRGVNKAAPTLNAFLDKELADHGLSDDRLAIVGFSQGTMMALHAGLRRSSAPGAILGYSGMLAGPEHLKDEIQQKPPIMLIHGDQDEVIPVQALFQATQTLGDAEVTVQWHISEGIGHGIAPDGLEIGCRFLLDVLGAR